MDHVAVLQRISYKMRKGEFVKKLCMPLALRLHPPRVGEMADDSSAAAAEGLMSGRLFVSAAHVCSLLPILFALQSLRSSLLKLRVSLIHLWTSAQSHLEVSLLVLF